MPRYSFDQFAAARNYVGLSFSPDGNHVAYCTNVSGQFNVWRQAVHPDPEGNPLMPRQLTAAVDDVARTVAWNPNGTTILTTVDHQANENFQLAEIPAEEGWLYSLTDLPDARHEVSRQPYSPSGQWIAYASNARNASDMDLMIRNRESDETLEVLAGDGVYLPVNWSPNGTEMLAVQVHSNTDTDLFLCNLVLDEQALLTPHEDDTLFLPGPWRWDGRAFYVISNVGREFRGLATFEPVSRELTWLDTPDWDVEDVDISHDDRHLAWTVNEGGYSKLYVHDKTTDSSKEFPDLPRGVYTGLTFSPTEAILGFYINRSKRPTSLYMLNIDSGIHWCLTNSYLGGVPESDMVSPKTVRYESFDGLSVPAFLYRPTSADTSSPAPAVLSIHGGPDAQERPQYNYNGLYQYLVDRGIGVLATNIRGSSGYGNSYQKLIYRDWGGRELQDLEFAARYLQELDWVDSQRLGVFGGSFGGFATLSCLTRLPQYWSAGVDIVGPSNLLTFTRAVPEFWKRFMKEWVGDPDEDEEMLRERSPITYVESLRAPLLVIQGANDPRVVKPESDQMVEQLRSLGQTVEYMVFEDEGHGFTKVANSVKAFRATAEWFEQYLLAPRGTEQPIEELLDDEAAVP